MNDDLLIQRYLDGALTPRELATFQQHLREDAALRDELRSIAEQAVAFGDMARGNTDALVRSSPRQFKSERSAWFTTVALAASVAVLATSARLFYASKPAHVLALLESTGTVAWSHGEAIQPGEKLPAGTLETIGEDSSAQFQFADGSLLSLQGDAELSFADEGQKILSLTRGTLSAQVRPQPAGRPMLVRTPSAEAEVVGTVFDLSTRHEDTLLNVDKGLVKLKRLSDGRSVDVPAQSSAVASLHTSSKLDAASTPEPLTSWSFDFATQTPPRDWRGISSGGLMHATPYVAKKHPDGRVTTHYGVSIRTAMLPQPLRLIASEQSAVRYRLRQDQSGPILLMLLTQSPEGRYSGNFECRIGTEELHPDSDGWCDLVVPLTRFHPTDKRPHLRTRHPSPTSSIIVSAIINTGQTDRQLVVARFELHSAMAK